MLEAADPESEPVKAALVIVMLASGCVTTSEVGPYVRSVMRYGPVLRVEKCTIVLEGETLREGTCSVEDVPIATLPQAPPPMQPPAATPPR